MKILVSMFLVMILFVSVAGADLGIKLKTGMAYTYGIEKRILKNFVAPFAFELKNNDLSFDINVGGAINDPQTGIKQISYANVGIIAQHNYPTVGLLTPYLGGKFFVMYATAGSVTQASTGAALFAGTDFKLFQFGKLFIQGIMYQPFNFRGIEMTNGFVEFGYRFFN